MLMEMVRSSAEKLNNMCHLTVEYDTQQAADFEATQPFIRRTTEEKPKTKRSYAARS
jgi:hypothetical protein